MEIGIYTFADTGFGGTGVSPAQRIPEIIEEIALADEVGLDVIGIGEHHVDGFAAPAPAVLLAAVAARTKNIRLFRTMATDTVLLMRWLPYPLSCPASVRSKARS